MAQHIPPVCVCILCQHCDAFSALVRSPACYTTPETVPSTPSHFSGGRRLCSTPYLHAFYPHLCAIFAAWVTFFYILTYFSSAIPAATRYQRLPSMAETDREATPSPHEDCWWLPPRAWEAAYAYFCLACLPLLFSFWRQEEDARRDADGRRWLAGWNEENRLQKTTVIYRCTIQHYPFLYRLSITGISFCISGEYAVLCLSTLSVQAGCLFVFWTFRSHFSVYIQPSSEWCFGSIRCCCTCTYAPLPLLQQSVVVDICWWLPCLLVRCCPLALCRYALPASWCPL